MITTRRAVDTDAEGLARIYLSSFKATYAFPLAHTDDEVRGWIAGYVIPRLESWLADIDGKPVALLVLSGTAIEQLYVHPDHTGRGIGRQLVDLAKARRPEGLELWTFQVNTGARRFYEREGFEEVERTHGSGNEEQQPDVRCVWRPRGSR